MPLNSGTKLGPFEIQSPIGAGGMGEVYRARDGRLRRDVAIKIPPASFSADPERLQRFAQESRAAAALNHPNILSIFDIGEDHGAPNVVSELLDGETLRDRLRNGALSSRKAVDYAQQIASGLAAAREKGIFHRDLLGRHLANGTQIRGKATDSRSDIFSFGAVLHEMLSGKRAFHGDSAVDTMSAILNEDPPDLAETNRNIPPALHRIVHHCLEKNPSERFQSARDLVFDLEALTDISSRSRGGVRAIPEQPATRRWLMPLLGALLVLASWAGIYRFAHRGVAAAKPNLP